jgi:hypothetical protein
MESLKKEITENPIKYFLIILSIVMLLTGNITVSITIGNTTI